MSEVAGSPSDELTQWSNESSDESEEADSTLSLSSGSSLLADEPLDDEQPKFSFIRVLVIFLIVGSLVAAALLLRRVLAVDSKEVSSADVNATPEVVDVIQMPIPKTPASTDRTPPKSLLELLAKSGSVKSLISEGLTPTSVSHGELKPPTNSASPHSLSELKENLLQFDKSKSVATNPLNSSSSNPSAESPTIPFRIPNFASVKPRPVATPEIVSNATVEGNPSPDAGSQTAPLAKALFQLERGRNS